MLKGIPCLLMRGGTSKGPFFLASDLPENPAARDRVLLAVMGSPDVRQIDGLGGGDSLTSKVIIVNRSTRPGIDLEYLFAQVAIDKMSVDTTPNCGNMLSGVGPFAIDRGLLAAQRPTTTIRIFNLNTKKVIEAVIPTPDGRVTYEGDTRIDGVPGSGAPIVLKFLDAAGAKTGKLLPTGNARDLVDGIEVSCVDFANPIVFFAASSLGKTGHEGKRELDADTDLLATVERIRLKAALLMGMGDASGKVLPKVVLVAPPQHGGNISSRYFVPWNCHAAHAVTGALCVAASCAIPGTIASSLVQFDPADKAKITIEHPSGKLETRIEVEQQRDSSLPTVRSAGIVRTARPIMSGTVFIPESVWETAALAA